LNLYVKVDLYYVDELSAVGEYEYRSHQGGV
jgi:hypothetical protein